jgi:hypothetical protein
LPVPVVRIRLSEYIGEVWGYRQPCRPWRARPPAGVPHPAEYVFEQVAPYTCTPSRVGQLVLRSKSTAADWRGFVHRCTLSIMRTVPDLERITMEFVRHPPVW